MDSRLRGNDEYLSKFNPDRYKIEKYSEISMSYSNYKPKVQLLWKL